MRGRSADESGSQDDTHVFNSYSRCQAGCRNDADKIAHLQEVVASLREQIVRCNTSHQQAVTGARDQLVSVASANQELRARIKQLEDQVDKRDLLVKEWNTAIGGIDSEIRRLVEDNQQASKDQDLLRNELAEVN